MTQEALKTIPGPQGRPLIGLLPERRKQPLRLFMDGAMRYGSVVRFDFGRVKVHLVSDPEGVRHVLLDNYRNYVKGPSYDPLRAIWGNGLVTSGGEFWRRQRKLAQPAFHHRRLAALAETMAASACRMADDWERRADSGEPFDTAAEMIKLAQATVTEALLGKDTRVHSERFHGTLRFVLEEINGRILALSPWSARIPSARNRRFKRELAWLNGIVRQIIEERRADGADRGDLLSMLMSARDEEGGEGDGGMSDRQLQDEVNTIFLAGLETTATALSWTWYLLSRHPEVDRRFRAELQDVLGGRAPTFADLPKLEYTKRVFEESLRLYPPAWLIARQALEDDVICGYFIPKGSRIAISPYVMHHLPRYWENPEGFDPDRFLPERAAERNKFTYLPFSQGPRQCIGNNFAQMEALIALAVLGQRYRLQLHPGRTVEPEPLIALRPKGGLWMSAARRQ